MRTGQRSLRLGRGNPWVRAVRIPSPRGTRRRRAVTARNVARLSGSQALAGCGNAFGANNGTVLG